MKRTFTILAASLLAAVCMTAQDNGTDRNASSAYHFTADFNMSASEYTKAKPNFGIFGFTINPGYRFNDNWAVFMPVSADMVLMNRQSTRNYVEQGTIGLGASYHINMKDHAALGFALTGGSTYIKSDLNYFKAKAAVILGFHHLSKMPYVSVGCTYMKPYHNVMKDKVLFECSIGMTIF